MTEPILKAVIDKCACDPTAIAAHISAAASLGGHHKISQAACDELMTALAQKKTSPIMLASTDMTAHLIAYFAHSLHQNWPWRRYSNLILVTSDPIKRVEAMMALDTLLPLIRRLGYTDKLTKYAIRYPDSDYFCNRRYKQVMGTEINASQKRKALQLEASTYENLFILTCCTPELSEKICITRCVSNCADASSCWYKDFLTELRLGVYSVQIYSPQYYVREMLRRQDGKRGRLPQHKTVMVMDDIDTITPILQAASRKQMHPQMFYNFLMDCNRLCGTKKSHKASVRAFTEKLRFRFAELLQCLRLGGSTETEQRLLQELVAGMEILEQKCWMLFRDNRRMDVRRKQICNLLCSFMCEKACLHIDGSRGIVTSQVDRSLLEILKECSVQAVLRGVPNDGLKSR